MKTENTAKDTTKTLDQQIVEWKAQYGKLYKSIIDDETYIWRKLRRKEYTEIMADRADENSAALKVYERQEQIALKVVLYPENIADLIQMTAGLATTISDEVIQKSGFDLATTEEL